MTKYPWNAVDPNSRYYSYNKTRSDWELRVSTTFNVVWPAPFYRGSSAHGSLEGVGGLKANEAYHSKADALLIPKMYFFFENLPRPFFGNLGFIKFGTFSALLVLPLMIQEEYGQIAHQMPPNVLLSNALGYEVVNRSVCRGRHI